MSLTAAAPRRRRDSPATGAPRPCPRRHPPIVGRRGAADAATGTALRRRPQGLAGVIWNRPGRGYLELRSLIAARPGLPGAAVLIAARPGLPGAAVAHRRPARPPPPPPSAPRARPVPPRRQSPRARPPAPRVAGPPQRRWRSQWARRAAGDDTRAGAGAGGKSRVSGQRAGKARRGGVPALPAPRPGVPRRGAETWEAAPAPAGSARGPERHHHAPWSSSAGNRKCTVKFGAPPDDVRV